MKISLIGMSGIGKTHWSTQLVSYGFHYYGCDSAIEKKLGISDMSNWLGQPYDKQYSTRSKKYLELENQSMKDIFDHMKSSDIQDLVIDTTGSVIYLDNIILDKLSKESIVVYLEANKKHYDNMFKLYLDDPKPVIWGEVFSRKSDESQREALARCYSKLLTTRAQKYKRYARCTIPFEQHHAQKFSTKKLIQIAYDTVTESVAIDG